MGKIIDIKPPTTKMSTLREGIDKVLRSLGIPDALKDEIKNYVHDLESRWHLPYATGSIINVKLPDDLTDEQVEKISAAMRCAFQDFALQFFKSKDEFVMSLVRERFHKLLNPHI